MRSSYGFQKFVQAIYVVFERVAIVTSHDADAVSASGVRCSRDASLHEAPHSTGRVKRALRIFIEKNRLFCAARAWRRPIARLLHVRRASGAKLKARRAMPEKARRKNFRNFFGGTRARSLNYAEARAQAVCIASKLSRAMRSHPGL
jgi:hypothetical protein